MCRVFIASRERGSRERRRKRRLYRNLVKVLREKGISTKTVGAVIGTTEKTAYNKLYAGTDFSYQEAKAVAGILPEYSMEYLFQVFEDEPGGNPSGESIAG